MAGRLENKAAIVTGSGFGIGRAIAHEFLREGANVALTDIREQDLISTVAEFTTEFGDGRVEGLVGDIRDRDLQTRLIERCVASFQKLDIIVNNAASQQTKPIEEMTEEHWHFVQGVNVESGLWLVQAALSHLKPGSAIVNLSSLVGEMALPGRLAYNVSKTANMGITRALAVELGLRGIRVNAICPGHIMSVGEETWREELEDWKEQIFPTSYALGRVGKPEEVARAVVFLASDDASFITGQSLFVDGGMSILCPEEAVFRAAAVAGLGETA